MESEYDHIRIEHVSNIYSAVKVVRAVRLPVLRSLSIRRLDALGYTC